MIQYSHRSTRHRLVQVATPLRFIRCERLRQTLPLAGLAQPHHGRRLQLFEVRCFRGPAPKHAGGPMLHVCAQIKSAAISHRERPLRLASCDVIVVLATVGCALLTPSNRKRRSTFTAAAATICAPNAAVSHACGSDVQADATSSQLNRARCDRHCRRLRKLDDRLRAHDGQ